MRTINGHQIKPETLARIRRDREAEQATSRRELIEGLQGLARRDRARGIPDSENIWLDMLSDHYGVLA